MNDAKALRRRQYIQVGQSTAYMQHTKQRLAARALSPPTPNHPMQAPIEHRRRIHHSGELMRRDAPELNLFLWLVVYCLNCSTAR